MMLNPGNPHSNFPREINDEEPADWWKELNSKPASSFGTRPIKPHPVKAHPYRRRGRRFRHGQRAAALRAQTGARLYLQGAVPSLVAAAEACGSNPRYVEAAVIVLRSEDTVLLNHVLSGTVPLLEAAKGAKRVANLVAAFRAASPTDCSHVGSIVGVTAVWDSMISPII